VTHFSFQIYDRWGKLIFSTNDVREGWNGKSEGNDCPPGTYGWIIAYDDEKHKVTNKGIIILLR
jgi:gliding motility-associated-like protein